MNDKRNGLFISNELKEAIFFSTEDRRGPLLEQMRNLEEVGIDCSNCTGRCCTFEANSVQTTPMETADIYFGLLEKGKINEDLVNRLETVIRSYRLDREVPGNAKRNYIRRTYTCPFFKHESLGCDLSLKIKPYGCLGFNALEKGIKDGENCSSDQELLLERENKSSQVESSVNLKLKEALNLEWDKRPMPVALLEFINKLIDRK